MCWCCYLIRLLYYLSKHHWCSIFIKHYSRGCLETIGTLCFICSSVGLFNATANTEIYTCIERNPFAGIEGQIISISFEVVRSIKVLFPIKTDYDTIFIDSFANIFDIKHKILIQGYLLLGIFWINKIYTWRYDIRFTLGYLSKIERKHICQWIFFYLQ